MKVGKENISLNTLNVSWVDDTADPKSTPNLSRKRIDSSCLETEKPSLTSKSISSLPSPDPEKSLISEDQKLDVKNLLEQCKQCVPTVNLKQAFSADSMKEEEVLPEFTNQSNVDAKEVKVERPLAQKSLGIKEWLDQKEMESLDQLVAIGQRLGKEEVIDLNFVKKMNEQAICLVRSQDTIDPEVLYRLISIFAHFEDKTGPSSFLVFVSEMFKELFLLKRALDQRTQGIKELIDRGGIEFLGQLVAIGQRLADYQSKGEVIDPDLIKKMNECAICLARLEDETDPEVLCQLILMFGFFEATTGPSSFLSFVPEKCKDLSPQRLINTLKVLLQVNPRNTVLFENIALAARQNLHLFPPQMLLELATFFSRFPEPDRGLFIQITKEMIRMLSMDHVQMTPKILIGLLASLERAFTEVQEDFSKILITDKDLQSSREPVLGYESVLTYNLQRRFLFEAIIGFARRKENDLSKEEQEKLKAYFKRFKVDWDLSLALFGLKSSKEQMIKW
jgi:hypothetical protein